MARETTTDGWAVPHWLGSLATLADAADTAVAEISETINNGPVEIRVQIFYEGGNREYVDLKELREDFATLEARPDISRAYFKVEGQGYTVELDASTQNGLSVKVAGLRAVPVHGLTSTLKRKLEKGVERVREPRRPPLGTRVWLSLLPVVAIFAGLVYLVNHMATTGFEPEGLGTVEYVFIAFFALTLFGSWSFAVLADHPVPAPKSLELVSADREGEPPSEHEPRSQILLWFKRHPILRGVGAVVLIPLLVGVVANRIG